MDKELEKKTQKSSKINSFSANNCLSLVSLNLILTILIFLKV